VGDRARSRLDTTARLLRRVVPADSHWEKWWGAWQVALRHVRSVANYGEDLDCAARDIAWLLDRAAVYVREAIDPEDSLPWSQRAIRLGEQVHGTHGLDLSIYIANLAIALGDA